MSACVCVCVLEWLLFATLCVLLCFHSVSAEKHLPIVEVTARNLQSYLMQKKAEGFTIIGMQFLQL